MAAKRRLIPIILTLDDKQVHASLDRVETHGKRAASSISQPANLKNPFNTIERQANDSGRKVTKSLSNPFNELDKSSKKSSRSFSDSMSQMDRQALKSALSVHNSFTKYLSPSFFSSLASRGASAFTGGLSGMASGVTSIIGGALSVAGGNMITSLLSGVKDQVAGAIKTGFDFNRIKEQTLLGFEIKLKGREKAEEFFTQIVNFAKDVEQELPQVLDSAQQLMSAFDSQQALQALSAITDRVAATGKTGGEAKERIDGIGLALQQMIFKGKVSGQEIAQLAERQVTAWKYLGDEIGRTDAKFAAMTDEERIARVGEMAEKGLLNAKTAAAIIIRGMEKEFGGTSKRIARETLSGIESNMSDRMSQLSGQATKNTFESYKQVRQKYLDTLNSETGESMAKGINDATGTLITGLEATLKGDLKSLGMNAFSSAAEGVKGAGKFLYDAGASVFSAAENGWRDAADQHSPSQVLLSLGEEAGASLALGFQRGARRTFAEFKPEIEKLIEENARRTGLDADLIRSMMKQESGGKRRAVSYKGASGLMQLMPATARGLGVTNIFDPAQNIRGGTDYMAMLMRRFGGDTRKALAGYNAGPGRVDQFGGVPPPSFAKGETYKYVRSIMADYKRRQMLSGASGGEWRGGEQTREIIDQVNSHTDDLYGRRAASEGEQLRKLLSERDTQKGEINALMQEAQKRLRWSEQLPQATEGERVIRERMMYGATETIAAIQRDLDNFLNSVNEQINNAQARLQDAALRLGTDAPEGMTWQEQAKAEGWQMLPKSPVHDVRGRLAGFDTPDDRPLDLAKRGGLSDVFGAAGASAAATLQLNKTLQETPKALEQIKVSGQDAFGNLPPLINTTAQEAKETAKELEAFAEDVGSVVSNSLDRLYRLDLSTGQK